MQLALVGPVGQRRSRRAQLSYTIKISQYPVDQRNAPVFHLLGFSPCHQSGKVDGPLMITGSIRTFDVAKLALETEIDDLVDIVGLELLVSTSAYFSSVQYVSTASKSFGKLPQYLTHKRQSAHRLKMRSSSERRSFSS